MQKNTSKLIPCMLDNFIFQEYLFNIGAIALTWLKVWAWTLWVFMCFGIIIKFKKESLTSKQKVETLPTFYSFVKKKIWKYFWGLVLTFVLNGTLEDYPRDYWQSKEWKSAHRMIYSLSKLKYILNSYQKLSGSTF